MVAPSCRGLLAAALIAALVSPAGAGDEATPTRERMQGIFAALSTALNLTLYDTPFDAGDRRAMVTDALRVLADNASELESHGSDAGLDSDYLRRSLARDASEAVLRYQQEHYAGARFLLGQLASNCVACHDKRPAASGFDAGRAFMERARIESIPPAQLAPLMVAMRQFEPALDVYEQLFEFDETAVPELVATGAVASYLKVALRVLDDGPRARHTLERLRRREGVPGFLQSQIAVWIAAIESFDGRQAARAELATARKLIAAARELDSFPGNRTGMAHYVLASGCLLRFLDSAPPDADVAEVFFLLGVCESHTTESPWVSQTEFYLESAVRRDPASRFAASSVDFLEAWVSEQYRGSGGVMVPAEVRDRIDELRALIRSSR